MTKKLVNRNITIFLILAFLILCGGNSNSSAVSLSEMGLKVIPYPKQVKSSGTLFSFGKELTVVLDKNYTESDSFTAEELIRDLKKEFNITAVIGKKGSLPAVVLTRHGVSGKLEDQGYTIAVNEKQLIISAKGEAGLFYGTQTFLQLIRTSGALYEVPGLEITDSPDILQRAIHYDTKHHQDKASYVKSFIKDLSRYKVNMLVWEWEDKFAYPSHPEIGAPGAFTMKEMQEFTRYAKQYHIQIVPLVQGLGHVSFILKWPQYKNLRELESSNWEFCPLKDGSYELLNDLWKDAMEATPGTDYIHIGSDETYELAACEKCKAKAVETGKSGLYQLFINRAAEYLTHNKRKVMAWETPMGWKISDSPAKGIEPVKGLVFTESYDYETPERKYVKESRSLGFEVFAYDPNPGVVPLMVPYFFERGDAGEIRRGSLEKSYGFISEAARSGDFNGMICTSWDDDGLHNQMWMMHFVNAAAWSWNGSAPSPDEFSKAYFSDYYGKSASGVDEIFSLLNEGVYYFAGTMERNVWHYGEIGQTHLPDMPRGDAIEYDPFWNTQYKDKVEQSREVLSKMEKVLELIAINEKAAVRHAYDFEIFRTSANMIKHTCLTYIDLSNLENTIREAHVNRFVDCRASVNNLINAQNIVTSTLARRDSLFTDLVRTYEETRLPRGYSTEDKKYFWQQDRARHFGFRRPDMSFLIYDEQLLDIEGYLEKLKAYTDNFKTICEN
jgi:hexosaminidase